MFLSRLVLNMRNAGARRDVHDWYEMHRTLCRAIAEHENERMLFRVENRQGHDPVVLVQTKASPDWDRLKREVPGYLLEVETKELPLRFRHGQVLRFRVRANASRKVAGKRRRLESPKEELEWLQRRFANGGAELVRLDAHDSFLTVMSYPVGRIQLHTVEFEGVVKVISPDTFLATLEKGIGPGKGMGMGLISVAPYRG